MIGAFDIGPVYFFIHVRSIDRWSSSFKRHSILEKSRNRDFNQAAYSMNDNLFRQFRSNCIVELACFGWGYVEWTINRLMSASFFGWMICSQLLRSSFRSHFFRSSYQSRCVNQPNAVGNRYKNSGTLHSQYHLRMPAYTWYCDLDYFVHLNAFLQLSNTIVWHSPQPSWSNRMEDEVITRILW